jgi:hypothetical protein
MTTYLAHITAPHLSPQKLEHVKAVLERELSRNGVTVKIVDVLPE